MPSSPAYQGKDIVARWSFLDTWILDPDNQAILLHHFLVLVVDWCRHGAPTYTEVPQMRQFTRVRFVLALAIGTTQGRDDWVPVELAEQEDKGSSSPQVATAADLPTRMLGPDGLRG